MEEGAILGRKRKIDEHVVHVPLVKVMKGKVREVLVEWVIFREMKVSVDGVDGSGKDLYC